MTFNKITFSRDKDAPWYSEIVEIEKRLPQLQNMLFSKVDQLIVERNEYVKKNGKIKAIKEKSIKSVVVPLCIALFLLIFATFPLNIILGGIGVIVTIIMMVRYIKSKTGKNKKLLDKKDEERIKLINEYDEKYPELTTEIEELKIKINKLEIKREKLIG